MKNIIFTILSFILLFSCTSNKESKNLDIQSAQLAHSKYNNIDNNLKTAYLVGKISSTKIINGGSLIFISSQAALKGAKYWGIYSLSKAAILRLSETLANELSNKKIRVNSICPGDVEGNMMKYAIRKIAKFSNKKESIIYNNYISNIPLNRFAKPSEIADACFYLSNSKYITGITHLVDGGENS